jgi:hypothetical protein
MELKRLNITGERNMAIPYKASTTITTFFFIFLIAVLSFIPVTMAFGQISAAKIRANDPSSTDRTREGLFYNPDVGLQYARGDFKWTTWGFAEGVISNENNYWRRVRQGMEFQLPRFSPKVFERQYRMTFTYEVDFTDNDFFRASKKPKIWENLYATIQDAEDPNKFRLLFGENAHILSREDNLSSGNLTTLNRSLILEEHGTVNNFGAQFGIQFQTLIAPKTLLQVSMQDNRGSLNTDHPKYDLLNDFSGKISRTFIENPQSGEKLELGLAVDCTGNVGAKDFTLLSAINQTSLGSIKAIGRKFSVEADVDYETLFFRKKSQLEFESIYSHFDSSNLDAFGGYLQAQQRIFKRLSFGELVPFIRYDFVKVSNGNSSAFQQAFKAGINYNLPYTEDHASLHFEYAKNLLSGSDTISTSGDQNFDEFAVMLRISTAPYLRF